MKVYIQMSATTLTDPTPAALVSEIGNMLADAMNALSVLSRKVTTVQPVLPPRRRVLPVAPAPAPVMRPRYMPPIATPAPRKTRQPGAADRIVAAVTSRSGVLASSLSEIAGYACGPAVLNRLSQSRGLTWWTTGDGAKLRYCGKLAARS